MNNSITKDEADRVQCKLCQGQVWMRKDHLQKHLEKVHSASAAPKKSFSTYKAKIASNYPPKLIAKGQIIIQDARSKSLVTFNLISRVGQRKAKGQCAACGAEQVVTWHYAESTAGAVDICGKCKPIVFERSFGK
ncbi:MAG: hypothetical protein WCP19_05815 [Chloroflexota bacterium]